MADLTYHPLPELDPTRVTAYAERIMEAIHADMLTGFEWGDRLPRDVGSFSALHDHCDANMYVINVVWPDYANAEPSDPDNDVVQSANAECSAYGNAVMDDVDRRLQVEAQVHAFTCPCCGIDVFSVRNVRPICSGCWDAECEPTVDGSGVTGYWRCQRDDLDDDVDG